MRVFQILSAALTAVLLTACSSQSGNVYSQNEARSMQNTQTGVVTKVRGVTIEGNKGTVGAATGAVAGGVLGAQVGKGRGRAVGGAVGAVGGGLAGMGIERAATTKDALEITVRLDSTKKDIVVVQEADQPFSVGQPVTIVSSGSNARVTPQ